MIPLLTSILLKASRRFLEQLWRHRQVHLRGGEVDVAQGGRYIWQERVHVGALAIPGREPMDGKAMPQIMEPGLVTRAVTAAHPGILTQTSEVLCDDLDRHGSAAPQDNERRTRTLRVPGCLAPCAALPHHLPVVWPRPGGARYLD